MKKLLIFTVSFLMAAQIACAAQGVKIIWTDPCVGETNMQVWRSPGSSGVYLMKANLPPDTMTWTDIDPVVGLSWYYVQCVAGSETPLKSGSVSVTVSVMSGSAPTITSVTPITIP